MRPLRATILLAAGGFASFYYFFALVPALAAQSDGGVGAGLATGVFMAATVLSQLGLPWAASRIRPHVLFGVALVLLQAPAALYALSPSLPLLLLVTALRGASFGVVAVVATVLVAAYAPEGRKGAALGLYGMVNGALGMVAPPVSLLVLQSRWDTAGYLIGGLVPLVALFALPVIRRNDAGVMRAMDPSEANITAGLRRRGVLGPALLFLPCAVAYGGLYTLLPVWSDDAARGVLFLGIGFGIARFLFARLSDSVRPATFVVPLLLVCAASVGIAQQFPAWPGLAVTCFVFGIGSGGMAGVSLVSVMANAGRRHQMVGSTVWNLSFDVGTAIGGLSFGVMYAGVGHHAVFSMSAGFLAVAVVAAVLGAATRQPSAVMDRPTS